HPSKTYLSRIRVDRGMLDAPVVSRKDLDGFPKAGRVIGFWSRLTPEKRVEEATRDSVRALVAEPDLQLAIIGDGECRVIVEHIVHQAGMSSRVVFLGDRPREYIRSAAAYMDAVIVPYGGSSLVEAAFLKRAVVAYDIE